jgi:hypothetical protein
MRPSPLPVPSPSSSNLARPLHSKNLPDIVNVVVVVSFGLQTVQKSEL